MSRWSQGFLSLVRSVTVTGRRLIRGAQVGGLGMAKASRCRSTARGCGVDMDGKRMGS